MSNYVVAIKVYAHVSGCTPNNSSIMIGSVLHVYIIDWIHFLSISWHERS